MRHYLHVQLEGKRAARAVAAVDADLAAHQAQELPADSEAQPGASYLVPGIAYLLERPEDCPQTRFVYTNARVPHFERQPRGRHPPDAQAHAARLREFDCVGEEIEQHLAQPFFID